MEALSEKNRLYLAFMRDMLEVCETLGLRWYIWGGMVADILEGNFQREHGDLDGFVENLENNVKALSAALTQRGYEAAFNEQFSILTARRDPIHAAFNPLRINGGIAEWKHIGDQGSVFFPFDWLDGEPRSFLGESVRTSGIRFEYMFRTNTPLLNPQWTENRPKDADAIAYYKAALLREGIDPRSLAGRFWTYNPFWFHRGYEDFFLPKFASREESD